NQQVLGLTHHGGHAAQGSTNGTVHQQATKKGPEVFQIFPVQLNHFVVAVGVVVFLLVALAGCHLVIDREEPHRNADDNGGDGQGIQKRRKYGSRTTKQEGQRRLGVHPHQNLGEGDQQQLFHEVNT